MGDMKATRAPWISRGDSADWWLGTEAGPIITVSYLGCVEVENPADMALIQSSRQLYDALQRTAENLQLVMQATGYSEETMSTALRDARAALAQARGEP